MLVSLGDERLIGRFMAIERAQQEKLGDLADFALLDLGELYYLADRSIVERGLRYFRDYAWRARRARV